MSSLPKRNLNRRSQPSGREGRSSGLTAGPTGPKIRVSGFVQRDGKVLLVRQRRGAFTYWLLPGGGVQRGETLAEALEREIREECGLAARPSGAPLAVVQTVSPDGGASRHLIQIVFPVEVLENDSASQQVGASPAGTDAAIEEIAWFDRTAVPELTLHPPIQDLVVAWLDPEIGVGSVPPGPCVVTGALWAPE
jgi:ADP-ribose pyrophosphatase YjhB (NUDIX family)